jgi:hypothetical protein
MKRETKIMLSSAVAADVAISAVHGQRPMTFSIIIWLFYTVIAIVSIHMVFNAIKYIFNTICNLILRGVKVLCAI